MMLFDREVDVTGCMFVAGFFIGISFDFYQVYIQVMTTDTNKDFLQRKLVEIANAVMYPMSNNLGKLPNDVIRFLRIDEYGQIWFTGHKPRGWVRTYDQRFPVRLMFYRKGIDFYIETSGVATIANAEEILQYIDNLHN